MFSELMPVLQNTIVTLTISRLNDQLLRVDIIPIRKTDKESDAENALSKPLSVTAPPAELDQDFARQVLSFSHSYERSAANIREIEEAHAAAVKAAEEERKVKKPATSPAKTSPRSDNNSKAAPGEDWCLAARGKMQARPRQPHNHCSRHPPEKRRRAGKGRGNWRCHGCRGGRTGKQERSGRRATAKTHNLPSRYHPRCRRDRLIVAYR